MRIVKHLPLVIFFMMTVVCHQASAIQSYREWKGFQIQEAQTKIQSLKLQIEQRKQETTMKRYVAQGKDPNMALGRSAMEATPGADLQVERLERQLQQEMYDLDLAKDLSVSDYFAGYLTKMKDKKAAFSEVAGKLSPDEVADLMTAYANSVFGTRASDIPASAGNTNHDLVK